MRKNTIVKNKLNGNHYRVFAFDGKYAAIGRVEETDGEYRDIPGQNDFVEADAMKSFFSVVEEGSEPVPDLGEFHILEGKLHYRKENLWGKERRKVEKIISAVPGGVIAAVRDPRDSSLTLTIYSVEGESSVDIYYGAADYEVIMQKGRSLLLLCTDRDGLRRPLLFEDVFLCWLTRGRNARVFGDLIEKHTAENPDGSRTECLLFVYAEDETKTVSTRITITYLKKNRLPRMEVVNVSFEGKTVKAVPVADDDEHGYVFITEKGIVYTPFCDDDIRRADGEKVLEAVRRYPTPVEVNEYGKDRTVFVFADSRYGSCEFECINTPFGPSVTVKTKQKGEKNENEKV